jgi:hypothetical protein
VAVGVGAAMLAPHFWSWNPSVALTTVAASVVLVNTQPAVVAPCRAWLHETPTRRQWIGIDRDARARRRVPDLLAGGAASDHPRALLGDLPRCGAPPPRRTSSPDVGCAARRLWSYVGLVYGSCFVVLLLLAAMDVPLAPLPPRELAPLLPARDRPDAARSHGTQLGPQAVAGVVNLTLLGEPVGATIIAAFLFGIRELPGIFTVVGGAIVFTGTLAAPIALPFHAPLSSCSPGTPGHGSALSTSSPPWRRAGESRHRVHAARRQRVRPRAAARFLHRHALAVLR